MCKKLLIISVLMLMVLMPAYTWAKDATKTGMVPAAQENTELAALTEPGTDVALASSSEPGPGIGGVDFTERSDDELLLIRLLLGKNILLSDTMEAYMVNGRLMLPLSGIMEVLDFPITVTPAEGAAEGWFLREDKKFSLNTAKREAIISGETSSYDAEQVEVHQEDIFVDAALLSKWFPVDITFSMGTQTATITSREPLPIEEEKKREEMRARLGQQDLGFRENVKYPQYSIPYRALSWPTADFQYSLGYEDYNDKGLTTSLSTLMSTDLGYFDNSTFLTLNEDRGLAEARTTFGRKSPEGELLGKMKATEFAFGDVFTPQLPLVAHSQGGRGATVSNFPLERVSDFDRVTLRGYISPGWEVELYRNDTLLNFQQSAPDGLYEFVDVPLVAGMNIIRLVFYGPYGEKREEVRRYLRSDQLVEQGKSYYSLSASQHDEDLIDAGDEGAFDRARGKGRFIGEFEHGLTQDISLVGNLSSLPLENGAQHTYTSAGLRTSWKGVYGSLIGSHDLEDQGNALQLAVSSAWDTVNVSAERNQFFDFVSERSINVNDPLASQTILRLYGTAQPPLAKLSPIFLGLTTNFEEFESGQSHTEINQRTGTFFGPTSLSHEFRYDSVDAENANNNDVLEGDVLMSVLWHKWNIRGEVGYGIQPQNEFKQVSLVSDYDLTETRRLRFGVDRQLGADSATAVSAGINQQFQKFLLGLNSRYDTDRKWTVDMALTFALGRDPRNAKWDMYNEPIAAGGVTSARVFLDNDQNGIFNDGDSPMPGIGFRKNGVRDDHVTNEEGIAHVPGMLAYQGTPLTVDKGTFEDPYLMPALDGAEIRPRPGNIIPVDFPVVQTGEIDGTVYLSTSTTDGEETLDPVSNVVLELVDKNGNVVQTTKSAYDGFYLFSMVPLGTYTVRVEEAQKERLKLYSADEAQADLTKDETVASGKDIVLYKTPKYEKKKQRVGEIIGNVYLETSLSTYERSYEALPDIKVELLTPKNEMLQQVSSGFDGSYTFSPVAEGSYILRANEQQLLKLGLEPTKLRYMATLYAENGLITGVEIVLRHKTEAELAADAAVQKPQKKGPTGIITGKVVLEEQGQEKPLEGIELRLLAQKGKVLQKVVSVTEGNYQFVLIPAGQYVVSVNAAQLRKLNLEPTQLQYLAHLFTDDGIVSEVEVKLRKVK